MKFANRILLCIAFGLWFPPTDVFCATTNQATTLPPMPPTMTIRSPVETFRSLLVMPAAERKASLAARSPEARQRLAEKIREYQLLTPEERDLRLKATELQWYLKPLMTTSATNRVGQLEAIPENLRDMVAVRLKQWDTLSPAIQRLMLTNHAGPEYFVGGSHTNFPPLPPDPTRHRMLERYNRLFELTTAEKEKVLATLSETEQQQMEKTLQAYKGLNPQQRAQCIQSFAKFSGLTVTERQEFLKNAERWAQMTPAQRQAWRELVSAAPNIPPLPQLTIQRPPPLPPGLQKKPGVPTTNGG